MDRQNRIDQLLVLLLLFIISGCSGDKKNIYSDEVIVLANAQIVDVVDGSIKSQQSVVIDGGLIQEIGAEDEITAGIPLDNHIDVEGRFLIPGLWDSHVHIDKLASDSSHAALMLQLYTINGVTSIREMGGNWEKIKRLSKAAKENAHLPTIYSAGPILENKAFVDWVAQEDPQFAIERVGIAEVDEVAGKIDSLNQLGVDFIKVRTAASAEVFFEIARAVKEKGLQFAGHVDAKVDLYEAVEAGISSLEHVDIFQLNNMSEAGMDSVIVAMERQRTAYCPTLIYFKQHRIIDKGPIKAFLADSSYSTYPERVYASKSLLNKSREAIGWAEESSVPWKEMEPAFLTFAKKVADSKAPVLAGTDGVNALVLPGFSLHDELQLYKSELNMTPLEILQSATINPSVYFGLEKRVGKVEENYVADLVILDKNPLEDIQNTKSIYAVIKSGLMMTQGEIAKKAEEIATYNRGQ